MLKIPSCNGVKRSIIVGGGGVYSYIRIHRLLKQWLSKEINCAEHEYMNIAPLPPPPPQLSTFLRPCQVAYV